MAEQDTAREIGSPVTLFDGPDEKIPGVKDFRPITEYIDKDKKTRISSIPPNQAPDDVVPEPDDPQTEGQPDPAPEHDPGIAPPEVDEPDEVDPTVDPEEDSTGSTETVAASPWDDEDSDN